MTDISEFRSLPPVKGSHFGASFRHASSPLPAMLQTMSWISVTCSTTVWSWCTFSSRSVTGSLATTCSPYACSMSAKNIVVDGFAAQPTEYLRSGNTLTTKFCRFYCHTGEVFSSALPSALPKPAGLPIPLVLTIVACRGPLCRSTFSKDFAIRSMSVFPPRPLPRVEPRVAGRVAAHEKGKRSLTLRCAPQSCRHNASHRRLKSFTCPRHLHGLSNFTLLEGPIPSIDLWRRTT